MNLTIEERIKRIEDELGITERVLAKVTYNKFIDMYMSYGFTKTVSKGYAHGAIRDGHDLESIEAHLVKRGAKKIENCN